jgi:hypothetical protein
MKLNANVALTLILLTLMFGAGLVSAAWGFALGREALKGITQPDVRPTNNLANRGKGTPTRREEAVFLKEEDVLARVKARISGKDKADDAKAESNGNKELSSTTETESKTAIAKPQPGFPIVGQDQGVVFEVGAARQQGGSLLLDVKMRNEGKQTVRFLYSFLNITDDRGRPLSATAEGLPGELPPSRETFSGTVSIPTALLGDANNLSLALTDYPDQKLQLAVSEIPIAQ